MRSLPRALLVAGLGIASPLWAQQPAPTFPTETVTNVRHDPYSMAYSADGTLALTGGGDGSIDIWDVRSGRLIRTMSGHRNKVLAVRFLADNRQVISASKDNSVKLWDVMTGRLLRSSQLAGPSEYLRALSISPDGTRVLSASYSIAGGVRMFDAASGRLLKTLVTGFANNAIFSADGARAALSVQGKIRIVDLAVGKTLKTLSGHQNFSLVDWLDFSPDGTRLVSGSSDKTVKLWDTNSGQVLHTLVHPDTITSVMLSADGTRIATGCDDHNLRIWDAASGRLLTTQPMSWGPTMLFSPDSKQLLSGAGSYPLQIKLWDVATGQLARDFGGDRQYLVDTVYSQEGSRIISAGTSLQQWDAKTGQLLSTLSAPERGVFSAAFSHDGSRVLWRMPDEKVLKLVDAATGRVLSTFTGHTGSVERAQLSPDASRVASGGGFNEKTIKLWDAATGSLIRTFALESVEAIAFSPDGTRLLAGSFKNTAKLWDVATGQLLRTFPHNSAVWSVAFSPDGTHVLTGDVGHNVNLWSVASGSLLRTFQGHTGEIYHGVVFSPDGKRALSAAYDKTVKLWDVDTGRLLRSIDVDARSPAFSPDGKRAVLDNAIWDLETGERLVAIIKSPSDDWLAITPEGFFAASERGADILSVVRGLDVWSIDQFYQSLYRPDLVREKLAGDPRGLVREAAANRDLGKVLATGSAPDVRVNLSARAVGSVSGTNVSVEAEIADRGGGIGRVEWRVNGVTAGIDTPAGVSTPLRLTRSLALDPGDNIVEVVAYNAANLIASVPAKANVTAQAPSPPAAQVQQPAGPAAPTAAAPKPRLFVMVAGVNDYADTRIKLTYAVPDAREISHGFQEAAGNLYQSVEVKLMVDADVTRDKLDAAFAEQAGKMTASDVFVLYLAGHGKTVDGRYYFIPQDFTIDGELDDKTVNAAVKLRGMAQDQWQRWFASVPARKSVILFDTCDSGTLTGDAGETQHLERNAANNRLSQATGRSILTASGGAEEALEGYHGHGLFTYELLDAMNQADGDRSGTIELNELAAYVYAQVSELSQKVFKQRQVPQMKLTANYPLTKQMRVLRDDAAPVAEAKPAYQVSQAAQLQVQPGAGATVVRSLSAKTMVTVVESKDGWSLIASDGKPIGYVATRDLTPAQ